MKQRLRYGTQLIEKATINKFRNFGDKKDIAVRTYAERTLVNKDEEIDARKIIEYNEEENIMASPTPTPTKVDPEEIQRYQLTWTRFTVISKYSIIFIALVLVIMALTLL